MKHERERVVDEVIALTKLKGEGAYFGEAVSKLSHAEQCAWQARRAGAGEELVAAALLHDIGHLLEEEGIVHDARLGVVDHDEAGAAWLLDRGFPRRVVELVRGHVAAKRYLAATNADYQQRLSPTSQATLALQGGPMSARVAWLGSLRAGR